MGASLPSRNEGDFGMSLTVWIVLAGSQFSAEPLPRPLPTSESFSIHQADRIGLVSGRQIPGSDAPQLPPQPELNEFPPPPPPESLEAETDSAVMPVHPPMSMVQVPPAGCRHDGLCYSECSEGQHCLSPGCPSCFAGEDDDTKVCKLHSTCDLYPHYAYYPKFHGHYYFRPYSYTTIAEHQQFAACIGLDSRMPYSLENFNRTYSAFPIQFTPTRAPAGTALPTGSGLPELESLLAPRE